MRQGPRGDDAKACHIFFHFEPYLACKEDTPNLWVVTAFPSKRLILQSLGKQLCRFLINISVIITSMNATCEVIGTPT